MGQPYPFAQGFYVSESTPISDQECINMRPVVPQTNTITGQALFLRPGVTSITTVANNLPSRGRHVFNDQPYTVNGESLYRIDRTFNGDGTITYSAVEVGTGILGVGRVIMEDNGPLNAGGGAGQICIIVPELGNQFNAWIYTEAGGLVQISDSDFDGPVNSLIYIDGFFMFSKKDSNKYFISNLRNGLAYIATDFAEAEADPDFIRGLISINNEAYIFGSITMEPIQNIGGAGFPFIRIEGAVQDKGLDSPFALAEYDGNMIFVGGGRNERPAIWITTGGKPQKISTIAIDNEIQKYSDTVIENTFITIYSQSGATFACITFPGERCFVYDLSTNLWHTRRSKIDGTDIEWRVNGIEEAYGELIVTDLISGQIGIMSNDVFEEYGNEIVWEFTTPPIDNGGDPFFFNSVELVGEPGTSFEDTLSSVIPQIGMIYSDNGGKTYTQPIVRGYGGIGQYDFRTIWDQLGRVPRSRIFRFFGSDKIKWAFHKLEINLD